MLRERLFPWLILFAACFAAVFDLVPFHDDWSYSTVPKPDFDWAQVLSKGHERTGYGYS